MHLLWHKKFAPNASSSPSCVCRCISFFDIASNFIESAPFAVRHLVAYPVAAILSLNCRLQQRAFDFGRHLCHRGLFAIVAFSVSDSYFICPAQLLALLCFDAFLFVCYLLPFVTSATVSSLSSSASTSNFIICVWLDNFLLDIQDFNRRHLP